MTVEIVPDGQRPADAAPAATLPIVDAASSGSAVHAGVLSGREVMAEYTLAQPAPRQWVAVGLVKPVEFGRTAAPRSLLVGHGTSAAASLGSLARRLAALRRGEPDDPLDPHPRRSTWPD